LAQDRVGADLVVGVACLDVADVGMLGVEQRERRVEIAGLGRAVAAGRKTVGGKW
jgi:hypothetical protein